MACAPARGTGGSDGRVEMVMPRKWERDKKTVKKRPQTSVADVERKKISNYFSFMLLHVSIAPGEVATIGCCGFSLIKKASFLTFSER